MGDPGSCCDPNPDEDRESEGNQRHDQPAEPQKNSWGLPLLIIGVVPLVLLLNQWGTEKTGGDTGAAPRPGPMGGLYPGSGSSVPDMYERRHIPGNGYHDIGGIEGKHWGAWQSTGSSTECMWSIRLASPHSGATILDQGIGEANTPLQVHIQPPGLVSSITGEIDGHRVVFHSNGCGSWKLTR